MINLISTKYGGILYFPKFIQKQEANLLFSKIKQECDFKLFCTSLFTMPRMIDYFGDKDYSYSGVTHNKKEITKTLIEVKNKFLESNEITKIIKKSNIEKLNSCLINLYRDQNDSLDYHSDNEFCLGPDYEKNILIFSLSLGDDRRFSLRSKGTKEIETSVELKNGSLIIMYGNLQHYYEHAVLKPRDLKKERLNLTYRVIA